MRIFVAVLHAIGEDNESNHAELARSQAELEAKVLAYCNAAYGDDPTDPPDARTPFHTLADLFDTYDVQWEEYDLDD